MREWVGGRSAVSVQKAKAIPTIFTADMPPRFLLIFFSVPVLLLASALSGVGFSLKSPAYWIAGTAAWIAWFFILFLIVTPRTDAFLKTQQWWLNRGARVIFGIVFTAGILEFLIMGLFSYWYVKTGPDNDFARVLQELQEAFRYNDGTALNQQATENLLAGKNPYANANVVETFLRFNGSYDRLTPLRTGQFADAFPYPTNQQLEVLWLEAAQNPSHVPPELESHVCYPAGSFILPAPFLAAGFNDIRIVYFLLVVGGLAYAIWLVPSRRRLIFAGLIVISVEIWNILAVGESGAIIFPFLLIAWMTIGRNNLVSMIFMGIAAATKQTAWFFLPFYLILLWQTSGVKSAGAAVGIITAIFGVFNVYFIAQDLRLWVESVTSPVTMNMFPLGVGFVSLVTSGLINVNTSMPFSIAEIAVFAAAVIWYARYVKKYPDAGPVLAVLPLFFAWRSLWTYFFYITIIIFAMMLMRGGERKEGEILPIRTKGGNSKL